MAVYVDDMRMQATVRGISTRWSHLMADTDEELHAFAARLGLRREWAQYPGTCMSHYDVSKNKRLQAIAAGAISIPYGGEVAIRLMARDLPRPKLHLHTHLPEGAVALDAEGTEVQEGLW